MGKVVLERHIIIQNKLGLHARASAKFVALASRYASNITLIREDIEVNGKSIMGIMMLAAAKGSALSIRTEGSDEQDALEAICQLIDGRFGEGE